MKDWECQAKASWAPSQRPRTLLPTPPIPFTSCRWGPRGPLATSRPFTWSQHTGEFFPGKTNSLPFEG